MLINQFNKRKSRQDEDFIVNRRFKFLLGFEIPLKNITIIKLMDLHYFDKKIGLAGRWK